MARQHINTGIAPNDGTGDTLKTSFTKCNDNFIELYAAVAGVGGLAPLDSPAFTGTPTAPTPSPGDADTSLATTAFVAAAVAAGGGGGGSPGPPQGRLTLQTGVPVMITTQSAKTTIYYTPYVGCHIPIYDGTKFVMTDLGGELSVATTDATKSPAAIGASKVNDWFVWNDAGTIRLGHGPDWTNDTTRSVGTALVMVNGILLNNAAITNGPAAQRGTYVGTTRSNASSQLDWIYGAVSVGGTAGQFCVWNAYNRRLVQSFCGDNTDSWTYASATIRAARAMNTMRHSFVCGLEEDSFEADYTIFGTSGGGGVSAGIGYDVTNAFSGRRVGNFDTTFASYAGGVFRTTALGFHFFQACENSRSGSSTFYGDTAFIEFQTGLLFDGWM